MKRGKVNRIKKRIFVKPGLNTIYDESEFEYWPIPVGKLTVLNLTNRTLGLL